MTPPPAAPVLQLDAATQSVRLACERDCFYVAGIARADGVPLRVRRGRAAGGTRARLDLGTPALPPGSYRLFVSLRSRYNAGKGVDETGEAFTIG